ncbi:MAG: glycosyltransferase family 4 protein [Chloroflexota bacterium]
MSGNSPEKLKILFYLLYYLPHRTGVPIYIQRLSEELVRRGHEVTVVAAQHQPHLPRHEVINGVTVRRIWAPPIPISRGMIMPNFPFVMYKLMHEHDIVQVSTPVLETGLIRLLAMMTGKKVIVTHHGDLILPEGLTNRFIQNTMFGLYKFLVGGPQVPRLVLYSQDYADNSYYARPFMDKLHPIYPPIEMPPPNMKRSSELKAQWSRDGGPVIGYAGRFVEEKRPDLLIRSLEVINQRYPNAHVVFAGEYDIKYENTWEKYQPIVQQYKDQLTFLGLIDDMQFMADFFAAVDVLALTSASECFALVQVEAMLSGTPVMMTNIPGGRVPVQVTGMGRLAESGDHVSMGQAILEILENPAQFQHTRQQIEDCFSFEETVNQYEKFFHEYANRT